MEKRSAEPSLRKRIQEGQIDSLEALKAEFKAAAKLTHPDLAGAGTEDAFLRLRRDYEAALRELALGPVNPAARSSSGRDPSVRTSEADYARPFAALELLLKRGFPKQPRHDKERLRYAYARIRARAALSSLDDEAGRLFDAAEQELLALKETDRGDFKATLRLFSDIVSARLDGTAALVAAVRMDLDRRSAPTALGLSAADERRAADGDVKGLGPATAAFLRLLAAS